MAVVEQLKSMIPAFVLLVIIGIVALVVMLMPQAEEVVEQIDVHRYEGSDKEIVLENSELKFVMDPTTTQFTVTNKSSGQMWYSNPPEADSDPLALPAIKSVMKSTLLLVYSTQTGLDTQLDNFQYSITDQLYNIDASDNSVKVSYTIGKVQREFVIPQVITAERMEELQSQVDQATTRLIRDYYNKYDINKLSPNDDKDALLEKYPILETEVIYVLSESTTDNVKDRFESQFGAAGYTREEYEKELEEFGIENVNERPVFNVAVNYRLDGEELVVEVPMGEIEHRSDYPVYSLSILPYFGAGSTEEEGYMFIPEGGGAIINFNNGKSAQNPYYADMYGWDRAILRDYLVHETRTYFGVFGMAKGNSSFLCMLEDGGAYAAINADISGRLNNYNYVNATYRIMRREKANVGNRMAGELYRYEENIPDESIVQRYRFVDSGSYVDMANVYHNYLEKKFGDDFAKLSEENVPVTVELVGAIDKVKQILGIPMSRPRQVTTYKEAQAILEDMKADGVENMSVKLSGWANGGVRQKFLNKVKLVSGLGGKKNLKALTSYAEENDIDLYLNGVTNYAYNSNIFDGFLASRDAATLVNKKRVKLLPFDPIDYAEQNWMDHYYLLKPSRIYQSMDNLASAADKYGAAGVSFADIGFQLSGNYKPTDHVTRQEVESAQLAKLDEIRETGKKIMINVGNDYALGAADQIVNMDLKGSGYTIIDEEVPFYQIAIHGYVNYAGQPLNLAENCEEEVLKSAEYGAGLYVTFMDAPITELQNTYYTQYFGANYDGWKEKFFGIYQKYEESLGHTFNQRIVNHQVLAANVFLTEYEDGTKVYVNYRYDDYTTGDGVKLPARDYVVK